jgi:hypothetical protein
MAETPTGSGADILETGTRTIGESGFEVGPLADGLWRFTTGVDVIDLFQVRGPDMLTHPADVAANSSPSAKGSTGPPSPWRSLAYSSKPVCIVGTQTPERITEATAALSVGLDRNDVYVIIEVSEGVPLP